MPLKSAVGSAPIPPTLSFRFGYIVSRRTFVSKPLFFALCARNGRSGIELSELLPNLAGCADDIAVVKSMVTDAFNHAPAQIFMNTGSQQFGRPSLGAWTTYGLGSESRDLPGFVVFSSGKKGPSGGSANWGSAFLPPAYNGVPFRSGGAPVPLL